MASSQAKALIGAAVAACVAVGIIISRLVFSGPSFPTGPAPQVKLPAELDFALPHLTTADEACAALVASHVAALDDYFAQAKTGSMAFADAAMGFGSKWRAASDLLPWTDPRHEHYLQDEFDRLVFSAADLEATVAALVSNFLRETNSVEDEMLVALRADVAQLGGEVPLATLDAEAIAASYRTTVESLVAEANLQIPGALGVEVTSLIGGEILTACVARLGVSTGILATGASSSWATCGIGLGVGLAVDQIVSQAWEYYAHPTEDLRCDVERQLDELQRELAQVLRERLVAFTQERSDVRRTAIVSILTTP